MWVALLFICAALTLASRHDAGARYMAALCLGGIVLMRFWVMTLPVDLLWLAGAATWVAIGAAALVHSRATSLLLIASGLCYLWARIGGYVFGASHPPSVIADLFGVAALATIGWRVYGGRFGMDRGRGVAGGHHRRTGNAAVDMDRSEGSQEEGLTQ